MGNVAVRNPRKIYSQYNDAGAIAILSNNVYKVTYYEIITGASGTLTLPSGATINAGEFSGANCILSEIDGNNKPTYVTPLDGGGSPVTATLNVGTGAWVKSAATVSVNVALIYSLNIAAINYQNLNNFYIIEDVLLAQITIGTTTITSGTNTRILYNNNGVLGEYAVTGTGTTAVLSISPTFNTSMILSVGNVAASTSGMTITNTNTSGYGTSLYFRGTSGSTYDYCAIQSENSGTGGLIRFQTANTSQVMTTRAEINSAGNMSVGFSVPFANLQVGRASADSATATTAINTSFYFGVGRAEYTLNSYRLIGLGYNTSTTTTFPTYIGYQEMSVSGKTKGDLIFGTRSVTTDTDPTERLRISNMGNISVGNAALATTATDGFLYVTACAGVPTGVPTAITGRIPIVADSTNNKLYIYSGGAWVALN